VRWAPLFAFLVFLGGALLWLGRDPALKRRAYGPGSSLGTGPEGASLARAYLEKRGASVSTLARPLAQARLAADAVLLRIDPRPGRDLRLARAARETEPEDAGVPSAGDDDDAGPSQAGAAPDAGPDAGTSHARVLDAAPPDAGAVLDTWLTGPEESFVRAGGRLVLAMRGEPAAGATQKVLPLLAGVRELDPAEPRALPDRALVDAQPVFEHDGDPAVAFRPLGRGEVWLLAEPEIFSNDRLGKADHLALLGALAGAGRPLVFDEHLHHLSDDAGLFDLLRSWGLGPALLLGALALGAAFWRAAVTVGPAQDPWRDPRSESVELVDSMAALYQRALSPAEALQLYRTRLVHEIALRKATSERKAEALLPRYAPGLDLPPAGARISDHDFRVQLAILVHAFERFRDEHPSRS
jgi:hypothetical protein